MVELIVMVAMVVMVVMVVMLKGCKDNTRINQLVQCIIM